MKKLFSITILLVCLSSFTKIGATPLKEAEDTTVAIFYPSPICSSTTITIDVTITGTGNYLGGTFSSQPGLFINAVTGQIAPYVSAPGNYLVTYSLPPGPNNPAISATYVVTISPQIVPVFDSISPICSGSNTPALPTVSNNGITGTWSPTTIDNTTSSTYVFTPDAGQCTVSTTIDITVLPGASSVITSDNSSSTVYVDQITNAVVSPLLLSCETSAGNYTYQWFMNNVLISNATSSTYLVDTATANGEDRIFTVEVTNMESGCSAFSAAFVVSQSSGVPLPRGLSNQTLANGSTLADLVVLGANIQWYASATNRNNTFVALPLNTVLIDNTTYYASQTINGEESVERLPVTVHLTLGIGESNITTFTCYPNPAKETLTITTTENTTLSSVSIYNTLGQLVQTISNLSQTIDVSGLKTGSYFIKVTSDRGITSSKFVKQ